MLNDSKKKKSIYCNETKLFQKFCTKSIPFFMEKRMITFKSWFMLHTTFPYLNNIVYYFMGCYLYRISGYARLDFSVRKSITFCIR